MLALLDGFERFLSCNNWSDASMQTLA